MQKKKKTSSKQTSTTTNYKTNNNAHIKQFHGWAMGDRDPSYSEKTRLTPPPHDPAMGYSSSKWLSCSVYLALLS